MLVTFDLGFAEVRAYPPGTHPGVLALRLSDQQPAAVTEFCADCLLSTTSTPCGLRRDCFGEPDSRTPSTGNLIKQC